MLTITKKNNAWMMLNFLKIVCAKSVFEQHKIHENFLNLISELIGQC